MTPTNRIPIKIIVRASRRYGSDILYVGDTQHPLDAVPEKIARALVAEGVGQFMAADTGFGCDIELDAEGTLYTVPRVGDLVARCLTNAPHARGRRVRVTGILDDGAAVELDSVGTSYLPLDGAYTLYKICE